MSNHRIPSAWLDPRPWLLEYFIASAKGVKWMEEEYRVMFGKDRCPWDADVQDIIRRSTIPLRTDLFDQEYTYLSDCAMYVDFVVHRAYVEFTSTNTHPTIVIQRLGRYIDMFTRHIADIRQFQGNPLDVETPIAFYEQFSIAWYAIDPPSPVRIPCWESLNTAAEATLCRSIMRIVMSYDAPTPAKEEHAPLVTLFRKAWPQKHQLDQFVKKFIRVVGTVEQRRVGRWNEDRRIEQHPTGDDVMRHVLQWWCLFHIGGYPHCKSIVTHPAVRSSMQELWQRIPTMTTQQLTVWSEALAHQPVVTLCVIKEFMVHAIDMNISVGIWLCDRSKWDIFRDTLVTYADRYRDTLPYRPVPTNIAADAQEELDDNRAKLKQSEKTGREEKRAQRMMKQAINANKRLDRQSKQGTEDSTVAADKVKDRLKTQGILLEESTDEEGDDDDLLFAQKTNKKKGEKERVDLSAEQFRVGLYDEGKDYDDTKIDMFDEQFIVDMNKVTGNPALTQLHIFVRCIHEVGASTRVPASFWSFVYNQMPIAQPEGLDLKQRTLLFKPTASKFISGHAAELYGKAKLNIDTMMLRMRTDVDQQWWMGSRGGVIYGLGEDLVIESVEPSLRPQFLGVRRCFQLTMISLLCHPDAIDLVAWLITLYFQHSRCGKPTITQVFNRLIRAFPYEYSVVYCLMMTWKEWDTAWRVPLPVGITENQLKQLQALFPCGVRPDFRIDWLVYCPTCKKIPALVDQAISTGSSYPKHYTAKSVAGFSGIFVDVRDQPAFESERKVYCPRKTGRAAQQCAQTCLRHMKMAGYLCVLNDTVYVICPQRGCGNKMQCIPDVDGFNKSGWMCSACVQSAEMERAMNYKIDYAETHFRNVRTRYVSLPNGRMALDVATVSNSLRKKRNAEGGPLDEYEEEEVKRRQDESTGTATAAAQPADHGTDVSQSIVGLEPGALRNVARHTKSTRGSLAVADITQNQLYRDAAFIRLIRDTHRYL